MTNEELIARLERAERRIAALEKELSYAPRPQFVSVAPSAMTVGDMIPVFYDGQWWSCHETYMRQKIDNGDADQYGRDIKK